MSFTLCLMQSCSTEEVELSTTPTVVGKLKDDLKLDQFAKKNFAENIVINWETINTIEKNGVTVYEVQISEIKQTTIESNLFQQELKYGLIAIKKGDEMRSYLIEAFSSVKHSLYANTIQNLEKFTGTLNVYELNGGLVGQLVVFNGKSTNPSSNNYLAPLDEAINLFYVSKSTTSRVPSCNITQFVQIINQHEVRHYVPTVIVGTYTNWGYSYSTFTLTTTGTYMSVPYPCGSDADYHHVPYRVITHEDVYDTFKIDDNALDPCTKGVLDKLKLSTEKDISKMINRFNPASSVFNIKMSTGKVTKPSVNWAETTKVAGSATDVNIVFSEDYVKGSLFGTPPTDLSVATTMAHEIIHAYLISLLEDHLKNSSVGINDFPTIFDAYVQQQATKNTSILPTAHHELIAKDYVDAIASTIEQFHLGDTFHSGYPRQVYVDMAWGGLQGTYIFNKTYPKDSTDKNFKDRERILDRINTERKGTPYQGYTPVGTPCKN